MSSSDYDSGVVPWRPPIEIQRQEIEQKRLIYGQFTTKELKRREPAAFEPSVTNLFMQLVEAERSVAFYKCAYQRANPTQHQFRTELQYGIVANERQAELIERKVKKALASLGFDAGEIAWRMMKLAEQDYDAMPRALGNFIADNAPLFQQIATWGKGNE